ncbi:unnamed protein product [Rodentolepis nana]|uniref:AN1-type domain-containing protein n=1 Tax=Rodentolepis nana TaxID=102285 RepID=A0A0R3T6N1_RODNA|nr:unnamed protein product [Rodentolepis nana]
MDSQEDDISCIFDASYSGSSLSRSSLVWRGENEMKIIRSSSYAYNIDDSIEHFDYSESLFRSLEMSSMPDLVYHKSDDIENVHEPSRRRDFSAAPDFYHGSYHNISESIVNLSAFMKNQNEPFRQSSRKDKVPANSDQTGVENHRAVSDFQPLSGNVVLESTNEPKMQSSTQSTVMDAKTESCIEVPGTFTQNSPYDIEMEVLVIPMVNDFNKTEIRIPTTSLSLDKKKVLKRIAAENELTSLYIGKGKSRYLVLRKKASLLQKQAAERDARIKIELEKKRKLEEMPIPVEDPSPVSQPCLCTVSIQTPSKIDASNSNGIGKAKAKKTSATGTSGDTSMNAAERRKARRAAERLRAQMMEEAKTRKRETVMQTCPLDWIICPWCTKDIPPAEQCGHIAMCRALHRQQNQEAMAKAQLEDFRRNKHKNHPVDPYLAAALKRQNLIEAQLKEVHPNDVNGMLHAAQRVCAVPNCTHIVSPTSGGQCSHCRFSFCPQHRPPHTGHSCSTALSVEKLNRSTDEEDAIADRQAILKQRMRQRINNMAERRRR